LSSRCHQAINDGCLITAQVLSVLAFILSFFNVWPWWVLLVLGLPTFLLLQTAWCCAMNKCGFNCAGVLALLDAGLALAAAIIILIWLMAFWADGCEDYSYDDYYSDNYYSDMDCSEYDKDDAMVWLSVSFAGALLWLITGILVCCFACGRRYQDIEDQLRAEGGAKGASANQVPSATAVAAHPMAVKSSVPIAAATPMQQARVAGTNTITSTHMPDGSVEKKTEVFNPDDSTNSTTFTVVTDGRSSAVSSRRLLSDVKMERSPRLVVLANIVCLCHRR
jgi:hypothetical protein